MYENFTIADAFKALNSIEEEEVQLPIRKKSTRKLAEGYSVNLNDSKQAEEAINKLDEKAEEPDLEIIDVNADTLEHLKKKQDYVGQMIMKCKVCQALKFMDADKLEEDPDQENIFNLADECPNCHSEGKGFEVIGQVGQVAEEKAVEEPAEEPALDNDAKEESEEPTFDNDFEEEPKEEKPAEEPEAEETLDTVEVDNKIDDEEEPAYDETDAEDDTEDLELPSLGDEIDADDVAEDDTEEKEVKEALEDEEAEELKPEEVLEPEEAVEETEEVEEEKEPILVSNFFEAFAEPEDIKKVRIVDEDGKVIFEDKFDQMLPNIKEAELVGINPDGIIINIDTEAEEGIDFNDVAKMLALDEDNADKVTILVDEEEAKIKDKSDALDIEGKVASIEPKGVVELFVKPVEGAEEIEAEDQSEEDSLVQDIVKENYLSMDRIYNINANEYWIRESIRTKEDLDVIFESFVLSTDNKDLINKFKKVTGYKDAIDEAREKMGYKAEIVENVRREDLSSKISLKIYDDIIKKAMMGPASAVTPQQVIRIAVKFGAENDFKITDLNLHETYEGLIADKVCYFDSYGNQVCKNVVARPSDFEKWKKQFRIDKLHQGRDQKNFEDIKKEYADLEYAFDLLSEDEKADLIAAVKGIKLFYPEGNEAKKEAGYKWFGDVFDSASTSDIDRWGISADVIFSNPDAVPQSIINTLQDHDSAYLKGDRRVSNISLAKLLLNNRAPLWKATNEDLDVCPECGKKITECTCNECNEAVEAEPTCKHCKDRKELADAIAECKNNNRAYNVTRSTLEGYRYDLTEGFFDDPEVIEVEPENADEEYPETEFEGGIEGEVVDTEEPTSEETAVVPNDMSDIEIEITQKLMRVAEDTVKAIKDNYGYDVQPEFVVADMMQDLKLIGGTLSPDELEDTPINNITKEMFKGYNEFYQAMDEIMTFLTGESIETTSEQKLQQAIRALDGPDFTTEAINKAIASDRFLTAAQAGAIPYIPAEELQLLHEGLQETVVEEKINLVEALKLDEASMSELKQIAELSKQIGIETLGDLNRFVETEMDDEHKDQSLVDLLADYLKKLGPDFKLKEFLNIGGKQAINEEGIEDEEASEEELEEESPAEESEPELEPEQEAEPAPVEVGPVEPEEAEVSEVATDCTLETATAVMAAYQNANKWLDSVKEVVYTNMNCPFFSSFIHELAHSMPGRFDKFGDILHTVNMEIPYPATEEITQKPQNITEAFDVIFNVLDDIKAALNAFIKCTDEEKHGMACAAETLLNDIEGEYPMLFRLQGKWNDCNGDTVDFDKYVMQYVEHKDNLLESLNESDDLDEAKKKSKYGKETFPAGDPEKNMAAFNKGFAGGATGAEGDTGMGVEAGGGEGCCEELEEEAAEESLDDSKYEDIAKILNEETLEETIITQNPSYQLNSIAADIHREIVKQGINPADFRVMTGPRRAGAIAVFGEKRISNKLMSILHSLKNKEITWEIEQPQDSGQVAGAFIDNITFANRSALKATESLNEEVTSYEDYVQTLEAEDFSNAADDEPKNPLEKALFMIRKTQNQIDAGNTAPILQNINKWATKYVEEHTLGESELVDFDEEAFDEDICEYFAENYQEGVIYYTEEGKINESGIITLKGIVESLDSSSEIEFTLEPTANLNEDINDGSVSYRVTNNLSEEVFSFTK